MIVRMNPLSAAPDPATKARKTLSRRVAEALAELERRGPLEARVHGARCGLKKARATLELIKPALPRKRRRRERALCRKAGRLLGPTRDAQALQRVWKELGVRIPRAERALAEDARRAVAAFARDLAASRRVLKRAHRLAKNLRPRRAGWSGIEDGLRRTYGRGLAAWERVRKEPSDERLHKWRRRVKAQRFQLDLFVDGDRSVRDLDLKLEKLGDLLGDLHDLVLLRGVIARAPRRFGGERAGLALLAIERRDKDLRRRAFKLAPSVYGLRPKAFARSVKRYWRARMDQRK